MASESAGGRAGGDRALWAILALALVVRVALLALTPHYVPFGDPQDYDSLARSLVDHGQYTASQFAAIGSPTAIRPPAYPYFLAAVYEVFGKSWLAGRIAGAVLGTVGVLLVWELARRLAGRRIARWAALAAALAPSLAWLSTGLLAENLYVPLLLGAVVLVLRHRDGPAWRWPLLAGLVVGASALTRSNGIVAVVPLLLGVWAVRRQWRDAALLVAAVVVVLVPWTIRNAVELHTFAPLGTQAGITMAGVYNQAATDSAYYGVWRPPNKIARLRHLVNQPGLDEARMDRKLRDFAVRFAKGHPSYVLHVTYHHLQQLFELRDVRIVGSNSQREQGIPTGIARKSSRGGTLLLLALALLGAFTAAARRLWTRRLLWLWATPVLVLAGLAPFVGGQRYRLFVDPFLCVLAGAAVMTAGDRLRSLLPPRSGQGQRGPAASTRA